MEELDFKELLNLFWSKIFQVIIITIVITGIGVVYTYGFVTPKYSSQTTLVLTVSESTAETESTITSTDLTLNSKLVSTYSEIIKSDNVLRQVISNLNMDINEKELKSSVSVKLKDNTEVLLITVTNENPEYAAKLANEIAEVFPTVVSKIYNINNIYIVDKAEVNNIPSNINHTKDIIIFAFAGIAVSVIYVLVANMLDTTIKTSEDIEKGFGLPVLISVPLIENFDLEKGGKRK